MTKDEGNRYQCEVSINTNNFGNINQSFEFSRYKEILSALRLTLGCNPNEEWGNLCHHNDHSECTGTTDQRFLFHGKDFFPRILRASR